MPIWAIAIACGGGDPADTANSQQLSEAWTKWESSELADYSFRLSGQFPLYDINSRRVVVRGGVIVTVDSMPYTGPQVRYVAVPKTVDEVFSEIESALDRNFDVSVEYHPELGYPTHVRAESTAEGEADEWWAFQLSDLANDSQKIARAAQYRISLASAREKWATSGITSYSFNYTFDNIPITWPPGSSKARITVRDGVIQSVTSLYGGEVPVPIRWYDNTIEELFEVVADAIESADFLRVSFDPELGYPTRIFIDYHEDAIDDETSYYASNLAAETP